MSAPLLSSEMLSARASQACDPRCQFLLRLHGVVKQVGLQAAETSELQESLHHLQSAVQDALARSGAIHVQQLPHGLRVNGDLMHVDVSSHLQLTALSRILRRYHVGGLKVYAGVCLGDWQGLFASMANYHPDKQGIAALQQLLVQHGVEHLEVEAIAEPEARQGRRAPAETAYRNAVAAVDDLFGTMANTEQQGLRRLKRAVQAIVDQVQTNESTLLGMRTLRNVGSEIAVHSTHVGLISIVLGERLGLDRGQLYELGLCGLLHDVGKQRLDPNIVGKRGRLTAEEWSEIQRHPREGLVALQSMLRQTESPWRPMLASYEHHMKTDQSGYPCVRRPRQAALFSRIVSVVDVFDAVTSSRGYRSRPWCPDVVLRNMLDQPSWGLDRVVVKALIHAIGLYPVGCLVRLRDGHAAVVIDGNPETPQSPVVVVVADRQGHLLAQGHRVDLSTPSTPSIHQGMEAAALPIDVSRYFI